MTTTAMTTGGRHGTMALALALGLALPPGDVTKTFTGIPIWEHVKLAGNLLCTLLPYHKPDNIVQPDWATQWFADEEAGKDMRLYYS